jgi:hypothetical protein
LPATISLWSERWQSVGLRLSELGSILKENGTFPVHGGESDRWDFSLYAGLLGVTRVIAMVEEHGSGRQLCRFRSWPTAPPAVLTLLLALIALAGLAGFNHAWVAAATLGTISAAVVLLMYVECGITMSAWRHALNEYVHRDATRHMLVGDGSKSAPVNSAICFINSRPQSK